MRACMLAQFSARVSKTLGANIGILMIRFRHYGVFARYKILDLRTARNFRSTATGTDRLRQ